MGLALVTRLGFLYVNQQASFCCLAYLREHQSEYEFLIRQL